MGAFSEPVVDAKSLRSRWDAARKVNKQDEQRYWINQSFLEGEQWLEWDTWREAAAQPTVMPDRLRITANKLQPNITTLLSKLTKTELAFEVPPAAADDASVQGARLAEKVLRHLQVEQNWEEIRYELLWYQFVGATAALAVHWDASAQPLEWLGAVPIGAGDVKLMPLSLLEYVVQPGVRKTADARWWCQGVAMPPEEVADVYNLDAVPEPDKGIVLSPLRRRHLAQDRGDIDVDLTLVLTYYERPSRRNPKGATMVATRDEVIFQGEWPFDSNELNLFDCHQIPIPGRTVGQTMMNSAISLQAGYNQLRSITAEHAKLAGNARMLEPVGSLVDNELTDTPGERVRYEPSAGKPEYLVPPQLPRWIMNESDRFASELDDVMHVHDISRGVADLNDTSGIALSLLAEKDDTPLGVMARGQATMWSKAASFVLKLYGQFATESRQAAEQIGKVGIPFEWSGQMLRGQTRVKVPLESVLPHSKVAAQAFANDLWERGIIKDPGEYLKIARIDADMAEDVLDADANLAQHENLMLACQRVVLPNTFDNHATHMAQHNRMRKSVAYMYLPAETRQLIDDHITGHERLQEEEFLEQMMRSQIAPGAAQIPQAHEPIGSDVASLDMAERPPAGPPPASASPPLDFAPGMVGTQ